MKPKNIIFISLGAACLLAIPAFGLDQYTLSFSAAWIAAAIGIVLVIIGAMTIDGSLAVKKLDNGLYQNPHPPPTFPLETRQVPQYGPREMTLAYLANIFAENQGWPGLSEDFLTRYIEDAGHRAIVLTQLEYLITEKKVEKKTITDPQDFGLKIDIFFVLPGFEKLLA